KTGGFARYRNRERQKSTAPTSMRTIYFPSSSPPLQQEAEPERRQPASWATVRRGESFRESHISWWPGSPESNRRIYSQREVSRCIPRNISETNRVLPA